MSAKMTLLEMTQNILSSMESDEVNSISDTVEAEQVATEIRTAYYELMSTLNQPSKKALISLEPSNDPERPNVLKIPDNVIKVDWIKYMNEPETVTSIEDINTSFDTEGEEYQVPVPSFREIFLDAYNGDN